MNHSVKILIQAQDQASQVLKSVSDKFVGFEDKVRSMQPVFQNMVITGTAGVAAFGGVAKQSIDEYNKLNNALVGLESIVNGTGGSFERAQGFIESYTKDGLVPVSDAATGLKNLLSRGFGLEEATILMNRFKDSAAFGRQSSLSLGDAVRSATEGLKNENSILVDNAGVTKNVSMMWKEYAESIGVGVNQLTTAQKREAELKGIMEETKFQIGDAIKYTNELSGQQALRNATILELKQTIGSALAPAFKQVLEAIIPIVSKFTERAKAHPELIKNLILAGIAISGLILLIGSIGMVLIPIIAIVKTVIAVFASLKVVVALLGAVITGLSRPIVAIITVIGLLVAAGIWLYKHRDEVKAKAQELGNRISGVWNSIKNWTTSTRENIKNSISQARDNIMTKTNQVITLIIQVMSGLWTNIQEIWTNILNTITTIWDSIVFAVQTAMGVFINVVSQGLTNIQSTFVSIWSNIKTSVLSIFDSMKAKIGEGLARVQSKVAMLKSLWKEAKNLISGVIGGGSNIAGARAMGGPVTSGQTYLVGENGPELFTPKSSGNIIPNYKLSGGVNININGVSISNGMDLNNFRSLIEDTVIGAIKDVNRSYV